MEVSFSAPYHIQDGGLSLYLADKQLNFNFKRSRHLALMLENGFDIQLPLNLLPDPVIFLGNYRSEILDAHVKNNTTTLLSEPDPLENKLALLDLDTVISRPQEISEDGVITLYDASVFDEILVKINKLKVEE